MIGLISRGFCLGFSCVLNHGYPRILSLNLGQKRTLPDWERLLGSENIGKAVSKMTQSTFGFVAPGSHAGKAINRENAEFALLVTTG